jgi:hypothetical protein
MNTQERRWRKSSRSAAESNCVQVAHHLDAVGDTKNPGVVLQGDIRRLLDAVQAGQITR